MTFFDVHKVEVTINGEKTTVDIFDTAGQPGHLDNFTTFGLRSSVIKLLQDAYNKHQLNHPQA